MKCVCNKMIIVGGVESTFHFVTSLKLFIVVVSICIVTGIVQLGIGPSKAFPLLGNYLSKQALPTSTVTGHA